MAEIKIRKLKTMDVFALSRILRKMDLKEKIGAALEGQKLTESKEGQTKLGVMLMMTALENLDQAQDEVTEFLASLTGMTKEQFSDLGISEFFGAVSQLLAQEGFSDFLK